MEPHPTPHDALFKAIFSNPENALGVFRAALPGQLEPVARRYMAELEIAFEELGTRTGGALLELAAPLAARLALLLLKAALEDSDILGALGPRVNELFRELRSRPAGDAALV